MDASVAQGTLMRLDAEIVVRDSKRAVFEEELPRYRRAGDTLVYVPLEAVRAHRIGCTGVVGVVVDRDETPARPQMLPDRATHLPQLSFALCVVEQIGRKNDV